MTNVPDDYDPRDDPAVVELERAEDDEQALEVERRVVEQSDNGPKLTDPEQPDDDG